MLVVARIGQGLFAGPIMPPAMVARGAPAAAVPTLVGLFAASRDGEFATVDPTLSELLGRRPISMCDLLAESVGRP